MFFPNRDQLDSSQLPPKVPPRPTSQKAASMPSEPSQDKVEMLVGMLGLDPALAVRYLKAKNNDVEAAINAVMDGEDILKIESATQWDDNAFTADREGNPNLHPLGTATAPNSRMPSPNRNNLLPASKEQEDADFAAAMQASQNDISTMPFQQEGGVIRGDGTETQFGPATRSHYEESRWAMVMSSQSVNELVPDVDVESRKHVPGEPRILRYVPNGDYLASFLTICHGIPMAREAFLMRDHVRPNYGQDGEWWKGHPIAAPRIVHIEEGSPAEAGTDKYDDLIAETQRLVAFLDASERSYASPGALTQTEVLKATNASAAPSKTLLELFVQNWIVAATTKFEDMANLFTTTIFSKAPPSSYDPDINVVDIPTNLKEGEQSDLSELMDGLLWGTDTDDMTESDNYLERPAQILIMHLYQTDPAAAQLRVDVPAELYMDKYLRENVGATIGFRQQIARGKTKIKKIDEVVQKLTKWTHPTKNERLDTRQLLKHTHGHFSGQNRIDAAKADKASGTILVDQSEPEPSDYPEITQKLEAIIASIDSKLTELAELREKTRKDISEMSKAPPGLQQSELEHRYSLIGVATKPNITYVLREKDEEEEEAQLLVQTEDDSTPDGMQWWRIEYEVNTSGSAAKMVRTKAPDYDVLRAVELEHSSALLVYGSDAALDFSLNRPGLPQSLQEFINTDNELFRTELQEAVQLGAPPAYDLQSDDIPRPSIERHERSSFDSTRVEGGSDDEQGGHSPPGYEQDGFMDFAGSGLGPDIKQGYYNQNPDLDDAPVVEIKLDSPADATEVEMIQKTHAPLVSGIEMTGGDADPMDDADESRDPSSSNATLIDDVRRR